MVRRPGQETGPWSMTFLPIVERELRVAARLPATFRNRTLTAGLVAAVAVVMLLVGSMAGSPASIGTACFQTLAFLTLCFCLSEGLRKTADCLSEEKREGTLGLLFLTDLRGHDVVLGKLAATSLNSFYGLVAILPVVALPLLLGGVTAGEYWRTTLALLNILFFSLCAGLAVSSSSTRQQQASSVTLLVLLLVCAVPLLTFTPVFYPLSPLYGFHTAFAAYYAGGQTGYWKSFGATQLWSWLLLLWASLAAPRSWQETEARPHWSMSRRRRWWGWWPGRNQPRAQMLERNPVLWLTTRNPWPTAALNLLLLIAVMGTAAFALSGDRYLTSSYVLGALILNFLVKVLVAEQSARFFAEARRENALELLLGTPLTQEQIINGQILALERFFLLPVSIILLVEFCGGLLGTFFGSYHGSKWNGADEAVYFVIGSMLYLGMFCADIAAVIWAGMWFGLSSKKPARAGSRTVLIVLVAPLAGLLLWCPGYLYFIGSPIFWIAWGRSTLYSKLREMTGFRYALNPVDPYRAPAPAPPVATPPVINPTTPT